jgi:hypothetical protein
MEAVLPHGEIMRMGGKIGQERHRLQPDPVTDWLGRYLAVITKIILRLIPLPKIQVDLLGTL